MTQQFMYISTAKEGFTQSDLDELLASARRNNKEKDLTGLLLFRRPHFMQLLEGPEPGLMEIRKKIEMDERHRDIKVLLEAITPVRLFPNWQLGFINNEEPLENPFQKITKILHESLGDPSNDEILRALALFSGSNLSKAKSA